MSGDTSTGGPGGPEGGAAPTLRGMDVERHLRDPAIRQRFVTPMFDLIAPRYDRFTRVFSFGMDAGWKREALALAAAGLPEDATVLDLACGTGDLAFGIAPHVPRGAVVGLDASPRMIAEAERRRAAAGAARVRFAVGDMMRLDCPDASVDLVMAGYGLRNVPDFRGALGEIARVLRPGGRLVTLDFFRPGPALWRALFLGYLGVAGNVVGWLWHREPVVYGYIRRSIEHFVSHRVFARSLEQAGLALEAERVKLLGGIAIHAARRRQAAPPDGAADG